MGMMSWAWYWTVRAVRGILSDGAAYSLYAE